MGFQAYKCLKTGKVSYVFESDKDKRLEPCACGCERELLPPNPVVMHGIAGFMSQYIQLDSIQSARRLAAKVARDAEAEYMANEYQKAVTKN